MLITMIGALWCPSCLIMRSRLQKMIKERPDIKLKEYDFDADKDKIPEFSKAKILPIVVFESENKELFRFSGEKSVKELDKIFAELKI